MGNVQEGEMMTRTEILLVALVVIVVASAARSEQRHREIMRLLSDFATMMGDALDALLEDD